MAYSQIERDTGLWYSAEYSTFSISDEAGEYQLTAAWYSGDAGNALQNQGWSATGQRFSTWDNDNDGCGAGYNCGDGHNAGWWYACCSQSLVNQDGLAVWSSTDQGYDVSVTRMFVKVY